jgi:hypothetical protein
VQRRFKVGYARAGRIIDQMAEKGIISGYEGSKPRRVLITREMWNEMRMQKEMRATDGRSALEEARSVKIPSRPEAEPAAPRLRTAPAEPAPVVKPSESAFVRRAMADAEERERRASAYADELPDDDGADRTSSARDAGAWDAEDID